MENEDTNGVSFTSLPTHFIYLPQFLLVSVVASLSFTITYSLSPYICLQSNLGDDRTDVSTTVADRTEQRQNLYNVQKIG